MAKATQTDTAEALSKKARKRVEYWLEQIESSRKREEKWVKHGQDAITIYEAGKGDGTPFNILYSNIETMIPALYSATPRPDVSRRFRDADPIGKEAANVVKRLCAYYLDPGDSKYEIFDDLMETAVLHATVPGRGQIRFKYDTEVVTLEEADPKTKRPEKARVASEYVCGEVVPWDRFAHGFARRWKDVKWMAYLHWMDRDDLDKSFGEVGLKCDLQSLSSDGTLSAGKERTIPGGEDLKKAPEMAAVWEIWDKRTRKVYYVSGGYPDDVLKETDPPVKLEGFFDCPAPLQFFTRVSSLCPQSLYEFYKNQAEELNIITGRINALIKSAKVRGFYDSTIQEIQKLLEAEENTLLPLESASALGATGQADLDKALWLFPFERYVDMIKELYASREQIKQTIYEIMGMSDIMRGASEASETATAQKIKNQWGTLRIGKMQKKVAHFARDCMRLIAEIAVQKLDVKTMASVCGDYLYPTAQVKAEAQAKIQAFTQAQAMQAQAAASGAGSGAGGMPGQSPVGAPVASPPQPQMQMPPQPTPEDSQAASMPSWEELQALLKNELLSGYKLDIETNSTVEADATEDKAALGELMNAIAQFLNGVGPLIQEGMFPFEAAKSILLGIVRKYKFGDDVEDSLQKMQQPPPKQDPKQEAAQQKLMQDQQALMQAQLQLQQKTAQADIAMKSREEHLKLEMQVFEAKQQAKAAIDAANKSADEAIRRAGEIQADAELDAKLTKHKADVDKVNMQAQAKAEATAARSKRPA